MAHFYDRRGAASEAPVFELRLPVHVRMTAGASHLAANHPVTSRHAIEHHVT